MLDFDRIKIVTKRYEKGIMIKFLYKFENGKEEKYTVVSLRRDGTLQSGVFDTREIFDLIPEGFNFKEIHHPCSVQPLFKLANIEDIPSLPIDNIDNALRRKKGGKIHEKIVKELNEAKRQSKKSSKSNPIKALSALLEEVESNLKSKKGE